MNARNAMGLGVAFAALSALDGCSSESVPSESANAAEVAQAQSPVREYTLRCASAGDPNGSKDAVITIDSSRKSGMTVHVHTGTQYRGEVSAIASAYAPDQGHTIEFRVGAKSQTCMIPEQGSAEEGCPKLETVRLSLSENGTQEAQSVRVTFAKTPARTGYDKPWEFANCDLVDAPQDFDAARMCRILEPRFGKNACRATLAK
jgi:hypothetical protein